MKVLITGTPGSGKSHAIQELSSRGLAAFDAEAVPGVVRLELKETGEPAEWPSGTVDWEKYAWNLQEEPLNTLLTRDPDVFIGVSASNLQRFLPLFDRVFALVVSDERLREQLEARNVHEFDQTAESTERYVRTNKERTAQYISAGAIPVDNMRPMPLVVDEILRICHDDRPVAESDN